MLSDRRKQTRGRESRAPRVFVSYRRGDTAPYAGRLYDTLAEAFGDPNVFMDIDTIDLGADYRQTIDRAIASCDVAIALIGRGWLSATDEDGRRRLDDPDDVLRLELERALARELVIVPACVQGAEVPGEEDLPPTLAPLARRQGIELRDTSWRDDVGRLLRRLERIAEEPSDPQAAAPARQPPGRGAGTGRSAALRGKGRAAAVALMVAVVGIAAALAIVLRDGDAGNKSEEASPGTASAATDERRLLAVIPAIIRASCERNEDGPEVARASVSCSGARTSIRYHSFASTALLDGWYELSRDEAAIAPDSGRCTAQAFHGEAPYVVAGETVGRYFCRTDAGEPELRWIDRRARVAVESNVWDGTGRAAVETLLRQWRCCMQLEL